MLCPDRGIGFDRVTFCVLSFGESKLALEVAGGPLAMIKLTRLDGEAFVLNAELIRYVERRGDTFVTLSTSERIVVRETLDEVVEKSIAYQQQKHFIPPPPSLATLNPSAVPQPIESHQS